MLILNTGGTFNKRYNKLSGELEVPIDNNALDSILASVDCNYTKAGVIYKDSLEIDTNDRKMLTSIIMESKEDTFVIIHGTDTMGKTAEFLDAIFDDRKIILLGAMKPFEIDSIESTLNFGMSLGFAKAVKDYGVYICMSGHIELWDKMRKNIKKGKFEIVE